MKKYLILTLAAILSMAAHATKISITNNSSSDVVFVYDTNFENDVERKGSGDITVPKNGGFREVVTKKEWYYDWLRGEGKYGQKCITSFGVQTSNGKKNVITNVINDTGNLCDGHFIVTVATDGTITWK